MDSQQIERKRRDSIRKENSLGVHFNANSRIGEKNYDDQFTGKLTRTQNRKRLYKKAVESMRKAGLIIQISAAQDGFHARNAPEARNGYHYGALTLSFGYAVHLAWKAAPRCPRTGRLRITYYQILCFIISQLRAWRLSQTPQLSCSFVDINRKADMLFEI